MSNDLEQVFGDGGALAHRIADKPYGRQFPKSLPPMLITRDLADIAPFLEEAADAGSG